MDVKIYDNIIPEDLLIENYNWAKDRSFAVHYRHMYYDFVQSRDGIFSTLAQQGIYRIAVGNKLSQVEDYAPPIAKLWKLVNERVFDNKATFEKGIPEGHSYINWPTMTGNNHYEDNNFPYEYQDDNGQYTCYVNGRGPKLIDLPETKLANGGIHRDCPPELFDKEGYYTVLVVINPVWKPEWAGEILFYDDEEHVSTHRKRGYGFGWPKHMFPLKPGSLVVFSSKTIHKTIAPSSNAPELALRVAFRVKVED